MNEVKCSKTLYSSNINNTALLNKYRHLRAISNNNNNYNHNNSSSNNFSPT